MGTTWSVLIEGLSRLDEPVLKAALQNAVQEVDTQMSTWSQHSDLMRFNAAPLDAWVTLPKHLMQVLKIGLETSKKTNRAFEMNVGDAVRAWGFAADQIDLDAIGAASARQRVPAIDALELDEGDLRARKTAPLALDLSGIAKGYGVDRLAEVLTDFGGTQALCAIDGEVRAIGLQSDGAPWTVAIEAPDTDDRSAHSALGLTDGAVATSGDYRHFVMVRDTRLSHTIDPRRGAPLTRAPASVTVMAQSCVRADAMATALMVMGHEAGLAFAQKNGMSTLFLVRNATEFVTYGTGVFAT